MVMLEFSVSPLGLGESVGAYVARSLEIVEESGLGYRLHAMGTILEGEWDEALAVVTRCYAGRLPAEQLFDQDRRARGSVRTIGIQGSKCRRTARS
jgi:uncharacterized protein (TIGR00106 family)